MALRTAAKDAQGRSIEDATLYACIEGFSSQQEHGSCAVRTRLRGDHPTVQGWPQFFLDANAPDDVVRAIRAKLWADAGAEALV